MHPELIGSSGISLHQLPQFNVPHIDPLQEDNNPNYHGHPGEEEPPETQQDFDANDDFGGYDDYEPIDVTY